MKIVECPRDAMQGIHHFIPTEDKIVYINQLLKVGFDVLDCGSFVSSKAIPQMRDTKEVLESLDKLSSPTKLLVIVANLRGAEEAVSFKQIDYLGFPFSISETFQLRNTNSNLNESFDRVKQIQELCTSSGKQLVVYLSMAFGNPYSDPWNVDLVLEWLDRIATLGISTFSLADTVGSADKELIKNVFLSVKKNANNLEVGAHLHSRYDEAKEKIQVLFDAGCERIDSAVGGYGGCPMAKDDLVGNIPSEVLIGVMQELNMVQRFDLKAFEQAQKMVPRLFV